VIKKPRQEKKDGFSDRASLGPETDWGTIGLPETTGGTGFNLRDVREGKRTQAGLQTLPGKGVLSGGKKPGA